MRKKYRELNLPGVAYGESKLDYAQKREEFFSDIGAYEMDNSSVENYLDDLVNNDNSRFWVGMNRDKDFIFKYNVLVQELKVRGIDYIR